jgi:hypothetical protein
LVVINVWENKLERFFSSIIFCVQTNNIKKY